MTEEQDPASSSRSDDEEDSINVRFQFGSVVVAKLGSFPWWPAMIDASPETGDIYWLDDFEDLSKKNASHYHVVFFDIPGKVTRSWVHSTKVVSYRQHYPDLLTEQERKAVKNLKGYAQKRRLVVARSIAEAALCLPVEERRKRHTFLCNYKGKITLFDDDGNKKVIDGCRSEDSDDGNKQMIDDGRPEDTEKVEPITIQIRKKPGPKPRNTTQGGIPPEVETYTIRKKSGSKSKTISLTGAEELGMMKIRKKPGPKSKTISITDAEELGMVKIRKKPGPKSKTISLTDAELDNTFKIRKKPRPKSKTIGLTDAEELENVKIRKKPGPKSKTISPTDAEELETINIRKEPGLKSKAISLTEAEQDKTFKISKKPGPKSKTRSLTEENTHSPPTRIRRTSLASSTSTLRPDTDVTTPPKKSRKRQHCSPTASVSPPSMKPASVPRATHELVEELSVFAASYPVNDSSPPSSPKADNISKRKGKKRRKESAKSQSGKKRGRPPKTPPATESPTFDFSDTETPAISGTQTPAISETSTRVCLSEVPTSPNDVRSLHVVDEPTALVSPRLMLQQELEETESKERNGLMSPSLTPQQKLKPEEETESKKPELKTLVDLTEPSENSLENKMTTFLDRIKNQTPKPNYNGKTISNLNILVAKTEEGAVIDLTSDDDEACQLRHGEVVFANLKGLQPWPAVVVVDPEINLCFIPKTGAPNYVHVFFFQLNRRAWVPIENVKMFEDTQYHPEEAEMLNYQKYCAALALAQQTRSFSKEQIRLQFADMQAVPMTGAPIVPVRGPDDSISESNSFALKLLWGI